MHYWHHAKGLRKYALYTLCAYTAGYVVNSVIRPLALQHIVDAMIGSSERLPFFMMGFVGLLIVKELCFRGGDFIMSYYENKQVFALKNATLGSLLLRSLEFFASTFSGALVSKQRRFVASSGTIFGEIAYQHLYVVVQVIGIIVVSAHVSWYLLLNYLFWLILASILIVNSFEKRMNLDKKEASLESKVTGYFSDVIGNIGLVKIFGSRDKEKNEYRKITEEHLDARMRASSYANWQSTSIGVLTTGMYAFTLGISYYLWKAGRFTPGDFVLMVTYSAMLSETLWVAIRSLRKFSQAVADANEMTEIMQEAPEIVDQPNAKTDVQVHRADIVFKSISFSHSNGNAVFKDFSLVVQAGQKVAIVGTTGSGKTTLVNLLLRTIEPQKGVITIDSHDTTDLTQDALKSLVSTVSQGTDLFHRTIRQNIAYGKDNATDEEIFSVAQKARIHDFIINQPEGYNTPVGERGIQLSGGQKQRIAIARALLHDAPILVFDEATSSLDNVTEKEIHEIIEGELVDKTVIIIAHRLSTVRNCDRIVVLEKGAIVQDGTHEQLVNNHTGSYYRMLTANKTIATHNEVLL